jgi:leader peptidase (prepilin peptidase)/N-methyltransferase
VVGEGGPFAGKPAPTTAGTAPPPGIVVEGSHCLKCGHKLAPWENIPLLSFLLLGGKCRSCRAPISWQYPAVELLTGLLFAAVVWRYGLSWQAGSLLVATGFLVAMSGIDARTTLLPDSLTLPLLWFGLLLSLVPVFVGPAEAILGAAVGYLSLWSVYWAFKLLTGKEGMGFGDFKLLAAIGAFCGWQAILPVVLMSSVIGAIVGITLITVQGRDRATPIPFGPYLAAAGWVQMMYGGNLLDAYLRWVGIS